MLKNNEYNSKVAVKATKRLQTEPFSIIPDRYWGQNWYLKPNHHRIFNYLIYQAKWAENGNSIGRISIGTYQLSELFKIPQKTVHRTLQFLSKIGEIILEPNSKFTIVNVVFLQKSDLQNRKSDLQNEKSDLQNDDVSEYDTMTYNDEEKKVTYKTEKVTYKFEKVTTPIDNIDRVDKYKKNEINFVKNKFSNNNEENEMVSKKKINVIVDSENTSVKADKAKYSSNDIVSKKRKTINDVSISTSVKADKANADSYIDKLIDIWKLEFKLSRNFEYIVFDGKDRSAISKLLQIFKKQNPSLDSKGMQDYIENFFKQALAIEDKFIYNGLNLAFILNQINQINTLINKSKSSKSCSLVEQATANGNYNLPLK